MLRRLARVIPSLGLVLLLTSAACISAAASNNVVQEDRVIAGGPKNSLEVRHLVLRGTNEQIGKALAEIAKERYGTRLEPAKDPLRQRAMRKFLEQNYPILLDRMRGVAAAYGKSIDDDEWDFAGLNFTELQAGCSIVQLPPSSMANGKSVVSRDYDFTTGSLSWKALPPGRLHPTARPYLLELHPDRGYASIAMVSYDLLSGVLDGINSEGLTVTLAMDMDVFEVMEATRDPAVGLGELQTLRLLLDTCANVDEAKQALMMAKQYYQYVPVHYLIADRSGNAFIWEYSKQHNKEYIIENPGEPLVMTNFNLGAQLVDGKMPSAEKARPVCKRYAYLTEKLAVGNLDDKTIRDFHQNVDAQNSQAADTTAPPTRTFWNAMYYPEDRRVRVSYFLGEKPWPEEPRLVHQIRSDYLEFRLDPTGSKSAKSGTRAASAAPVAVAAPAASSASRASSQPATSAPTAISAPTAAAAPTASLATGDLQKALQAAGASIDSKGSRIVGVGLDKATKLEAALPLLNQLADVEVLNLGNPAVTDAHVRAIQGLPKLHSIGLMGASTGDAAIADLKRFPSLRVLNISATKVTDAGLAQLRDLTALEYLGLKGTAITDAGLVHLKDLTGMTTLNIADTKVSDAGLVNLTGMTRLESVNLSNDNVSDAGLAQLARMPSVAGINVTGTKVTDAGLVHLKQLPKLTKLNVTGTAVTEQGVKDAKKYLPFWATVTR
jgi:penicillin V acylase-like amidase (Ntn superfamily)